MRQPMTNRLAMFTRWSVHQKLNRVSLVQFGYAALYAPSVVLRMHGRLRTALYILGTC